MFYRRLKSLPSLPSSPSTILNRLVMSSSCLTPPKTSSIPPACCRKNVCREVKRKCKNIKTNIKKCHRPQKLGRHRKQGHSAAQYNDEFYHTLEWRKSTKKAQPKPSTSYPCSHCIRIIGSKTCLFCPPEDLQGPRRRIVVLDCK